MYFHTEWALIGDMEWLDARGEATSWGKRIYKAIRVQEMICDAVYCAMYSSCINNC
jgi:hypothetical protein